MPAPARRPTNEDRIRAALWFAERGFGIFPVWSATPDGTCRCPKGADCESAGKHPITKDGFHDATADPVRIRTFLSAASEPNYGLVNPEGVLTLDVDGDDVPRFAQLEHDLGRLETLRTLTAKGEHVFARWPAAYPRPLGRIFGLVTRWGSGRDAGYVIGPRSVHPSGKEYEPGPVFDIAELPEVWARAALAKPEVHEPAITVRGGPASIVAGHRHDYLRDQARHLVGVGLRGEALFAAVWDLNVQLAEPKDEAAVRRAIGDAESKFGPDELDPETGRPAARPRQAPREVAPGMDAADLLALELPPMRWIVPELVPEGTTIIAAEPKVGKSCLVYQIAVEAAIGGDLLGRRVTPGSVLYLALEDGKRRGQDRLRKALAGRTMPQGRLEVRWDSHPIGEGLEDDIRAWLDCHPDGVMVAVDTLGKVRPSTESRRSAYDVDVAHLARLQDIFRDRPVALVIVHHARKATTDDFLTSVSGTYGITGSADTVLVVRRKRLEAFGTFIVTGRDIPEAEVSVRFNDGVWEAAPGALTQGSFERSEVYRVIEERGPIFPKAIGDEIGMERTAVQHMVDRLVQSGAVARAVGGYVVAGVVVGSDEPSYIPHPPYHSGAPSLSEDSDGGQVRTRAREGEWLRPCRDYARHQSLHRQTPDGYVCDACDAEEDA